MSIHRINPVGLRILSLRGCTAACIVNLGFEGNRGGVGSWEGGKSWGLDNGSRIKACCMLYVSGSVGVSSEGFDKCCMQYSHSLLHGYGRHQACLSAWCLSSVVDVGQCPPPATH